MTDNNKNEDADADFFKKLKQSLENIDKILGKTNNQNTEEKRSLRDLLNFPSQQWEKVNNEFKNELGKRNRWDWFTDYFGNMVQNIQNSIACAEMDVTSKIELKSELDNALMEYEPRNDEFTKLREFIKLDSTKLDKKNTILSQLSELEKEKNNLITLIKSYLDPDSPSTPEISLRR